MWCTSGLRIRACTLHRVHILFGSTSSFSFYELPFLRRWFTTLSVVSATGHCSHFQRVEKCITSVRQWMCEKSLKRNDSKTEVLLMTSRQLSNRINCPSILIGECGVETNDVARILGVLMDRHASMEEHITSVCKSAQFHLFNISRIRKHLTREATEQLIHAFITSKLDYCNALLYGLPITQIQRLQRLQNIAARIVTLSKKILPYYTNSTWPTLAACFRKNNI